MVRSEAVLPISEPIFVPIAQVNALKGYGGKQLGKYLLNLCYYYVIMVTLPQCCSLNHKQTSCQILKRYLENALLNFKLLFVFQILVCFFFVESYKC